LSERLLMSHVICGGRSGVGTDLRSHVQSRKVPELPDLSIRGLGGLHRTVRGGTVSLTHYY
jgi:hypothetical protein